MKTVIVGSTNPVKVQAARQGFEKMFPGETFEVSGVNVASGVPDQPFGDAETLLGARNRAQAVKSLHPEADFCVGMEGGVVERGDGLITYAWFVVLTKEGSETRSKTAEMPLPPKVAKLVREGVELGHANDAVFSIENSKHGEGMSGLLTGGLMPRVFYYETAFYFALAPIKLREVFEL